MPGMPATGLGGIFYALLMLWVLLREVLAAARGHRDRRRWRRIVVLACYIGGILAAFWTAALLIVWIAGPLVTGPQATFASQARAIDALVPNIALVPFVLLALLLMLLQALRAFLTIQAWRLEADGECQSLAVSPVGPAATGASRTVNITEKS